MNVLIVFIILFIGFYVISKTQCIWVLNRWRRKWLHTDKWLRTDSRKLTMFQVRELILKGDKDSAIYLYADLFKVEYKESKKAVDELEKSIQKKNSGSE